MGWRIPATESVFPDSFLGSGVPRMIRIHEVTKRFGEGERSVLAVDRLSFEVPPGQIFGLLGPNGAGKTTTLRMILGLLKPDEGYAEIGGCRTDQHPVEVKRRVGLVSANEGVYPWLTGRELLEFFADLYGVPPHEAQSRIERLATTFDLKRFFDRRCATYSTGQRQRVLFARGLIHDPPVMLLDEPTRGLDVIGTQSVFEYLRFLQSERKAVVISTHRLEEAERFCDRFGLIFQGRLAHLGTLAQLRDETGQNSLVEMFVAMMRTPATAEASA